MLAAWKIGAATVSCNPMLREKELLEILHDSGSRVLVSLESLYDDVVRHVRRDTELTAVITTSELEFLTDVPQMLACVTRRREDDTYDFREVLQPHLGKRPPDIELHPDDLAFLTYTSGTTGPAKGAYNTHGNIVFSSTTYRNWIGIGAEDVILGVSPLFHITGLIAHVTLPFLGPAPVVLHYRFDSSEVAGLVEHHRVTFIMAAITVYIAILGDEAASARDLSSLRAVYSGGAPIATSTVRAWETLTGTYIHNLYGMTETTSPSHGVPFGRRAPVDAESGRLSVGVPVFNTIVRVVDDDGNDVPPGQPGELVTFGPQVVPRYWDNIDESEQAFSGGGVRTGDIGFMDEAGWFYVVDRSKDMIIASGFKVWPREVEEVLYEFEGVREAAVIGAPDPYRGETVYAFVSLANGATATEDELIQHCRARMAAYKYPRKVEIWKHLPKNDAGKILKRELRAALLEQASVDA
jgi:long-chain acyl-CoA synthetase